MVRTPCCEKMGLKKGPWTREEDRILINYINSYGHENWRALPRLAGLLRCGKSCRLRWTNYLKPDIKRGNFSREEEQTIIELHAALGNRWSAIAARLPGRTDNEIKNVWHTHLKKRVNEPEKLSDVSDFQQKTSKLKEEDVESLPSSSDINYGGNGQTSYNQLNSPQHSYSEISSIVTIDKCDFQVVKKIREADEDFWSKMFSSENPCDFTTMERGYNSSMHDDMQFWLNVLTRGEELSEFRATK